MEGGVGGQRPIFGLPQSPGPKEFAPKSTNLPKMTFSAIFWLSKMPKKMVQRTRREKKWPFGSTFQEPPPPRSVRTPLTGGREGPLFVGELMVVISAAICCQGCSGRRFMFVQVPVCSSACFSLGKALWAERGPIWLPVQGSIQGGCLGGGGTPPLLEGVWTTGHCAA